ncbi:MAG TPA: restriction endonuclease subunit S, partial [Anaerolineae bacterium]|nr:restriction endonuclease subunit S [Anaerolineae bacterium]
MGKWIETTIGDFSPFEYGTGLKEADRQFGHIPVYGSNGIVGYHNSAYVKTRGVIIGRKGTVGAVHYSKTPFFPIDTTFYVQETENKDIRFIYYLLKSIGLEQMNSDSAVPGLNRTAAHSRVINVPISLNEQQAIADVLGTLDDKIELNRHMNRTLESMGRAVFRELMKEERGKETTIGEVVSVVGGSTPSTKNPSFWESGDIHWATPKDLSALQDPILLDTNSRITE